MLLSGGLSTVFKLLYSTWCNLLIISINKEISSHIFNFELGPCAFAADGRGWVSQSWADLRRFYSWRDIEDCLPERSSFEALSTDTDRRYYLASVLSKKYISSSWAPYLVTAVYLVGEKYLIIKIYLNSLLARSTLFIFASNSSFRSLIICRVTWD